MPGPYKEAERRPEPFDFLGFTHISGKDRKGTFAVKRKTSRKRMRSKLLAIKHQLRQRMHDPTEQTGDWLQSVVQGYFGYHAVPGNTDSLGIFRQRVTRLCRWALRRTDEFYEPADLPEPPALSLFADGIIGQLDAKRLAAESRKMH